MIIRKVLFVLVALLTVTVAGAGEISLTEADSWTAGTDSLYSFYGADYSVANGYAELMIEDDKRAILWAADLRQAGTYSFSLDNQYSNYYQQYNYWMVLLVNDGSQVNLVGGPSSSYVPAGGENIYVFGPVGNADGNWHSYEDTFEITQQQADDHDYIAFVMVGSKKAGQVLGFDNFITNVPEPTTIALLSLGGIIFLKPKRN